MKIDITPEIYFQTARSGGKGGQHVNKVETMVEGRWNPAASGILSAEQKEMVLHNLAQKITAGGYLLVKSQASRSQAENKTVVISKLNALAAQALIKKKSRIATKPSKAAKEKRIEHKKQHSFVKQNRRSINHRTIL